MSSIKKLVPEIITIGIIVIYAFCYPLISQGLQFTSPLFFSTLRTFIAGISIVLVLPLFHQPIFPPKNTWKLVILFSIPAVVLTYGAMFLSPGKTGLAIASVLGNLQPLLTVFLAIIFLHEKLSVATRTVLLFGTFGVLFITIQSFLGNTVYNFESAIIALFASLSAAITSVLAKKIKRPDIIITLSAWQYIIGSIPLFFLSQLFESNQTSVWSISFLGILLFLAIIGTAATTVVWYILIQKVDVSRLSVLFFLLPAFGLLVTYGLYAIPISIFELVGIVIILIGVIIGFKKQSESFAVQHGNQGVH